MSKQRVLEELKQHRGEYLSGEGISQTLGLSRTAIWKTVDALRREGYTIEAHTGRGYQLTDTPDALTEPEIRSFLGKTDRVGHTLHCLDSIGSTNTYAKQIALEGAEDGTVVVANCQVAGRGRRERPFQSPADKGIYLTALLQPDLPTQRLLPVTALGAVAVCNAVETVCGVRPQIKWTNDLVLNGKKICGILTEMSLEGETGRLQYLVMGIGLNVHHTLTDFPPDVREIASSIAQETSRSVSRPQLAAAEIEEIDKLYNALLTGDIMPYWQAYRRDCLTLGKDVQILGTDGSRELVKAVDLDENFGLLVEQRDGTRRVVQSGEVSVRGLYGYVD